MPNRIIKESICSSENVDQLSAFQETFFYRLIVNCDDFGRMDARPKILASRLFPLKDIRNAQIEDALRALTSAELVTLYEVDGKPFLQMKTWDKHQQVRAKRSKFPAPDDGKITYDIICNQVKSGDSKCPRNPIQSESNPNTNTNTKEKPERLSIPPTVEDVAAYCKERGNGIDPEYFCAYYGKQGWKLSNGQKMSNWKMAVVTWEKRDKESPPHPKPIGKVVNAQRYTQRPYNGAQETPEEMMARLERMGS